MIYVTIIDEGLIIFFELGAVVFWSFQEEVELEYLKNFEIFFKFKPKIEFETDVFYFRKGEKFSVIFLIYLDFK